MKKFPHHIEFRNHLTGETYALVRAEDIEAYPHCAERVASICNEPLIYNTLFRESLNGKSYSLEKAEQFISWAKEGWSEETYFVFFICNENNDLVGCMDIKSAQLDLAEIGYWTSDKVSGSTTNALVALIRCALAIGYRSFVAYVKYGNERSIRALERAGFTFDNSVSEIENYRAFTYMA